MSMSAQVLNRHKSIMVTCYSLRQTRDQINMQDYVFACFCLRHRPEHQVEGSFCLQEQLAPGMWQWLVPGGIRRAPPRSVYLTNIPTIHHQESMENHVLRIKVQPVLAFLTEIVSSRLIFNDQFCLKSFNWLLPVVLLVSLRRWW